VTLPPGPRQPAAVQTLRWLTRHLPLLEECRARYGDAFTLRFATLPPLVFVSDPDSAKRIFAADRENSLPAGRSLTLEPVLGERSLLLLEGEEHLRRRRLMLPPFHGDRMRAYEGIIASVAAAAAESWPRGEPFPMRDRMQAITLDVILAAVFGVADGPRHDRLRELLGRVLEQTRRPLASALAVMTRPLGRFGPYGPFQALLDETDAVLAEEIADRRRDPALADREDILSMLVAARFDDGSEMDDRELRDQLMTLLAAGHETTATALAWSFDFLLHDAGALARARESAAGDDPAYLDAVATEALRLRPVITSVGRKLGAAGTYGGHELPEGTSVMVAIYLLHTRPDVYPDPYAFRPERFLGERPDTYSWIPFGGGIRRCLGAAFAQMEMRIVLREVLNRAELRAADRRLDLPRLAGITLVPKAGARVLRGV
jgi:cytochrome P450